MVTRREVLALAGAAPVLIAAKGAQASAAQAPQAELEQHESVRAISSFEKTGTGVVFHCTTNRGNSIDVTLTVCAAEIVRFQMCPDPELKNVKGLLEIKEDWPATAFTVTEKADSLTIETASLRIEFQKKPWKYAVYDKQGKLVVQEDVNDVDTQGNFRGLPLGFTTADGKSSRSNETFALAQDENLYGFGERFTKLNKLGLRVNGWVVNPWGAGTDDTHKPIPFMMSTAGYGIFANTTFRTRCDMGSRSVVSYTFLIDDPRLDFFIIYGPSMKQVLARYEEITGWPAFPPKESFGIWIQINGRIKGEEGPVAVAKKFRALGLPMDYFTSVVAMESTDLQEGLGIIRDMSSQLGQVGIKVGIHVAPFLKMDSEIGREAIAGGYALMKKDGSPYEAILVRGSINPTAPAAPKKIEETLEAVERDDAWRDRFYAANRFASVAPDFTNPAAVKWWKDKVGQYMKAGCFGVGMSDFGEDNPADAYYYNKKTGREMHNLYTLLYHKATYEAVVGAYRAPGIDQRALRDRGDAALPDLLVRRSAVPMGGDGGDVARRALPRALRGAVLEQRYCGLSASRRSGGGNSGADSRAVHSLDADVHAAIAHALQRVSAAGAVEFWRCRGCELPEVFHAAVPLAALHLFTRLQRHKNGIADDPGDGARVSGRSLHLQSAGPIHFWRRVLGGAHL